MKFITRNLIVTILFCVAAGVGLSGCATTAQNIEPGETLDQASSATTGTVVFGKFRLLRNGDEVQFGEGVFASAPTLRLHKVGSHREFTGEVGQDGEFAWVLQPGSYRVSSIGFSFRGERIEPETNFTLAVSEDHRASYAGTITLETTIDSGYHGTSGTVDRVTVRNDCETECGKRLARLGISKDVSTASLFHWEEQVASTN